MSQIKLSEIRKYSIWETMNEEKRLRMVEHGIPYLLDLVSRLGKSLNWFVHLAHGVGKAGNEPEPREEEAAADEARELLQELEL